MESQLGYLIIHDLIRNIQTSRCHLVIRSYGQILSCDAFQGGGENSKRRESHLNDHDDGE